MHTNDAFGKMEKQIFAMNRNSGQFLTDYPFGIKLTIPTGIYYFFSDKRLKFTGEVMY